MIEERAVVIEAQGEYVWVEAERQRGCRSCGFARKFATVADSKKRHYR
jgi:positive regulator of sigma E activity